MFNRYSLGIMSMIALSSVLSCSEDSSRFEATFPEFEGLQAVNVETNLQDPTLKAGHPFVVKAVERAEGKHLYQANYRWSITPNNNVEHKYRSSEVYRANGDATDTITVDNPGSYRITLVATYDVGGVATNNAPNSRRLPNNGGDISYQVSALKYIVTLSKVFQISE